MKIYKGLRRAVGQVVVNVVEVKPGPTPVEKLYQLRHFERHSQDGFEFGYGGSGPADLARSILIDLFGITIADAHYMNFKWAFIAPLKENTFEIREEDINLWLLDGGARETRA